MSNTNHRDESKQKWWLHPMDPENLAELSDDDRKNAKKFNHWLLIWGVMFFGVVLGVEPLPEGIAATPVWRLLLVFSPAVSGIFLIYAFIRLFNNMKDELIRKIYYEALAIGFLFAFVIGMFFELSTSISGASTKAGPLIFGGLLVGYFFGLFVKYRAYNAQ